MTDNEPTRFDALGLPQSLIVTLDELGYEAPSPIQAETIPALLAGRDLVGQAQTGTGKTAAFALPILARRQADAPKPSALVLAPTRELAIQVAEAFHRYAGRVEGFHVLPIYGGQSYGPQLAGLRRGADVVVGTPGRVIDHLNKGTLDLSALSTLVLDEADEMLRMGFIDDVEQVLAKLPGSCQIALFSATMPTQIRRIAERYLKSPQQVTIRSRTTTAAGIRQRYWLVSGMHKLDALTRILEVEEFDGMIVFARTRIATEELASRLDARGFAAAALNGDVPQPVREKLVEKLRKGEIDILVATDVAARGLDVERISHVVNYDIPYDTEAYVHRIGRTGRAGRTGEAILFVAPRERGMLRAIERATRQPIEVMGLPSVADVNEQRVARFKAAVRGALETEELDIYRKVAVACQAETGAEMVDIAAALARLLRGGDDLLLSERVESPARPERSLQRPRREKRAGDRGERSRDDSDKTTYRIEVGRVHGVKPGNIVGAIANEGGLDADAIGRVVIRDQFSLVDLPQALDPAVLQHLGGVRVASQALKIRPDRGPGHQPERSDRNAGFDRPRRPDRRDSSGEGKSRPAPSSERKSQGKTNRAAAAKTTAGQDVRGSEDKSRRGRPVVTRAQRKAGHGSRSRFRK
ncbi:DEAD/DEAH box helicase [Wenzhouxiangella limi]|uniref:ATP-dependent RNA helicase DeaD n=1 Tax=Wenzhouxiangella limi TaxID=2707351 RepID=A0A845V2R0_9GAMM|nr:DEAD/DEAH box helicase [Wenzhouxiangella limi]NDY96902.1 DEAD/DEAH box helicase [Wenzhouxiangella limi]